MIADERLEILLNKANQTIADLKYNHSAKERVPAMLAVKAYRGLGNKDSLCEWDYEEFILHLTDVIDRMETALENMCAKENRLDYLEEVLTYECEF